MLEIFIPTKIKGYSEINDISDNFSSILNSFSLSGERTCKIEKFSSTFFEGIKLESDIFIEDLVILCNGEFGDLYFIDFDSLENNFHYLATKIIGENQIGNKLESIMLNIAEVTGVLTSDKLLTNTKKTEIKSKIDSSLFALSGVTFLLYELKKKTEQNLDELKKINGKLEFESQAMLLSETSITKKLELQAGIDKLEVKVELFIDTIRLLIK